MTEDTSVKLAVTVNRNPGRCKAARYTATYGDWPYDIEAEGPTATEAKANLTAKLATALRTITEAKPTFARDDDGSAMWVAVPAWDGGATHWRVTDRDAWGGTSTSQPAADAFTSCVGMTVIPNR
jgi:hypothetical protein